MITLEQFLSLRSGDLVVWRGKYLRTITKGPADERKPHKRNSYGRLVTSCVHVELAIRRRSWTKSPKTVYNFNDARKSLSFTGKRGDGLMLESEWLTLRASGFGLDDIERQLLQEETQHARLAARFGDKLCRAYPRIKRLIEQAVAK